jgi:hypothetical protein
LIISIDPSCNEAILKALEHEEVDIKLVNNAWQNEFINLFVLLIVLANLI